MGAPIRFILCDIEGTTTSISFVHETLFPYSRERLRRWVEAHRAEPKVRAALDEARATVASESGRAAAAIADAEAEEALLRWIAEDRKHPALKRLQGWIWAEGYAEGALVSHLYEDVAPALARWRAAGKTLGIYSSGSVEAQRQLFSRTPAGDLTPLLAHHFDTAVGGKRERRSYEEIARRAEIPAAETLFLSDVPEELDAARAAGMRTTQLVRPGTRPCEAHPVAKTFDDVKIDP